MKVTRQDLFVAASLAGLCANPSYDDMSVEETAKLALSQGVSMEATLAEVEETTEEV